MIVGLSRQLISSSEQGNVVTLRTLLAKDAVQVDSADQTRNTGLMYAAKEGHVAAVRILLQHGANPNQTNSYGWTPLMQASVNGHVRCVKCLLEFGADPNIANQFKQTSLVHAAAHGHNDIVQTLLTALLEDRKDTEFVRSQMSLALSYSAYHSNIATVRLLLHYNADINHVINGGNWNALLYSILAGDTNMCQTLLNSSSKTNLSPDHLPLIFEVLRNSKVDKSILMEKVPLPDSSRAISIAIESGDLEGLQKVIGLADAESNRLMGGTPLMFASVMGQTEIVRWLLESGADINAKDDNNGWTALMQAVFHGHYRVVEYLLAAGADPNISNNDGLNAHSIASMLNDEHMSDMLIRHCRVLGESPGKHWWKKLTTKFSTIRALTAFKTRLKDVEGGEGTEEEGAGPSDATSTESPTDGEAKKEEKLGEDGEPDKTVQEVSVTESAKPRPKDAKFPKLSCSALSVTSTNAFSVSSTHVIEVAPLENEIAEEEAGSNEGEAGSNEEETGSNEEEKASNEENEGEKEEEEKEIDTKKENGAEEDVKAENGDEAPSSDDLLPSDTEVKCENIKSLKCDHNHDTPPNENNQTEDQLTSPDSGFISRGDGNTSLPGINSDLIQSEYDGIDVDLPELPPDICLIEPSYDWHPADVRLDEETLRNMRVDEEIIRELNKLNVLF